MQPSLLVGTDHFNGQDKTGLGLFPREFQHVYLLKVVQFHLQNDLHSLPMIIRAASNTVKIHGERSNLTPRLRQFLESLTTGRNIYIFPLHRTRACYD